MEQHARERHAVLKYDATGWLTSLSAEERREIEQAGPVEQARFLERAHGNFAWVFEYDAQGCLVARREVA